jgi:hypothetical protein
MSETLTTQAICIHQQQVGSLHAEGEGFRSIVNQKFSYGANKKAKI